MEVNVDSLGVANFLGGHGEGSSTVKALVKRIHSLINMDWDVVVKHTYHEANRCADWLANVGWTLMSDIVFYELCQAYVSHLLYDDTIGVSTLVWYLFSFFFLGFDTLCNKKDFKKLKEYKRDRRKKTMKFWCEYKDEQSFLSIL